MGILRCANALGGQTFSWLYISLLLDAIDECSSSGFDRPDGWWHLVDAIRHAVLRENPQLCRNHGWNYLYVDSTRLPLKGRRPLSSTMWRNADGSDGSYADASEQERLQDLPSVTAGQVARVC